LLNAMRLRRGVISRTEALCFVDRHVIDKALRAGVIIRAFPGVYVLAELTDDAGTLDYAACVYVSRGALSHTTALRTHAVPHQPADLRRHVTVGPGPYVRVTAQLVVHRRQRFIPELPDVVVRDGVRVVRVERAIIESWPLLVPGDRRNPAITAVSSGLTTGPRLLDELAAMPRTPGCANMRQLFGLLALGCRSELELRGHTAVFDDPMLRPVALQHSVRTPAGTFILDRAHVAERVGVELDGAAWHGSQSQRERDVRRGAALAACGWLIVRFTHAGLRDDPVGCRTELAAILAVRRRHRAS
jgi:very-short-patch-repair endonuclease